MKINAKFLSACVLCSLSMSLFSQPYGYPYGDTSSSYVSPYGNPPYGYPYDPFNFPLNSYYQPYSPYQPSPYYYPPQYPYQDRLNSLANPYFSTARPPMPAQGPYRPRPLPPPRPELYQDSYLERDQIRPTPNRMPDVPLDPTVEKINQVLKFWFGPLSSPTQFPAEKISMWEGTPASDNYIKRIFFDDYRKAVMGQYADWRMTPKGRLALIIMLDQIPRHIYPDQPQMFATDAMARGLALEGIQRGDDLTLFPIERAFFYMPLQHSESAEMQALSVSEYQKLVVQSPPAMKPIMQEFLRLAVKHQEVVDRFGRFPHRNAILGRQSTPEEKVYLGHKSAFRY